MLGGILFLWGFERLLQLLSGILRINQWRFYVFLGTTRILRALLGARLLQLLPVCLLEATRRGGVSSGRRRLSCGPVLHGVGLHGRACRILHSDGGVGHVLRLRCGEFLVVRVFGLLAVSCGNLLE